MASLDSDLDDILPSSINVDFSRAELLDAAVDLLGKPEVQAAPVERRIKFLQSKGLTAEEIITALRSSGQPLDASKVEDVFKSLGPETSPSTSAWAIAGTLVKICAYVGMAGFVMKKWSPFTVSIDPAFYRTLRGEDEEPRQNPKTDGQPEPSAGNWYDAHAGDLEQPKSDKDVDAELKQLREDNSSLRVEVATLRGQLRALQRKVASSSPTSVHTPARSAEDLLKPMTSTVTTVSFPDTPSSLPPTTSSSSITSALPVQARTTHSPVDESAVIAPTVVDCMQAAENTSELQAGQSSSDVHAMTVSSPLRPDSHLSTFADQEGGPKYDNEAITDG